MPPRTEGHHSPESLRTVATYLEDRQTEILKVANVLEQQDEILITVPYQASLRDCRRSLDRWVASLKRAVSERVNQFDLDGK